MELLEANYQTAHGVALELPFVYVVLFCGESCMLAISILLNVMLKLLNYSMAFMKKYR